MHGMMKIISNFKEFYNDINGATLTGAIDVIVVEQPDGTFNCSPFHVRFGKLGVLRSKEKVVDIEINNEPQNIHMKLGESGEAFFVEELENEHDNIPEHLATSPIPVSELETIFKTGRRRSLDLTGEIIVLDNQANDYTKRRYTDDNMNNKTRERDFFKRQIGLGNIEIIENSAEDMTLSMQSTNSEEKSVDHSDTIFKMEMDNAKVQDVPPIETKSNKKKRKKMRRKNAPRKVSTTLNPIVIAPETIIDKVADSATDRSSLDSNSSDPELKDLTQATTEVATTSNYKMIDADFHFFSDTELNTPASGVPVHGESVQSDSEIEVKFRKEDVNEASKSWEWGGFPSVSQATSPMSEDPTKDEHKSMLSGMFSFMKQKHGTPNVSLQGGMYLSDISSVEPEIAEMYFTKTKTDVDMDCESGNGPSLTQSPISGEGCKSIDSDFDEQTKQLQAYSQDISLSMCGWEPMPTEARFLAHVVKFSDLCNNPTLLENNDLVVRIRDKYYSWKVASPIIASIMIYGRPLVQSSVDQLCTAHMAVSPLPSKQVIKPEEAVKTSWWYWRRSRISSEATPSLTNEIKMIESGKDVIAEETIIVQESTSKPISIDLEAAEEGTIAVPKTGADKCRKTLRLSSKQIASLNLRDGANQVEFSVTTAYQGTTRCMCNLYKWKWDDKIVISDIDGTITKSDVLGHILPIVGKDWAQTGVAQLFNKIKDNGYRLLYLSARAIGQARITREYLRSIRQGNLSMPDGPILLNPTSLINAFHREVIEKKPEQFKISCMSDIKALFPTDSNPFYAGYGNRINDVWAYTAVGIPIVRIFTINPKGELKHELTQTFQSSYSTMTLVVDQMFPPRLEAANDYSQFVYWRDPVSTLDELPDIL